MTLTDTPLAEYERTHRWWLWWLYLRCLVPFDRANTEQQAVEYMQGWEQARRASVPPLRKAAP